LMSFKNTVRKFRRWRASSIAIDRFLPTALF
jgi:hypothetical protein